MATPNDVNLHSPFQGSSRADDSDSVARLAEAGFRLAQDWRAAPHQPQHATQLLQCASRLAMSGFKPRDGGHARDQPRARGMISFVVCSVTPDKLALLRSNICRNFAGERYEIIHIADARSLCEGYLRGLRRARGELLIFCHDDIGIINDDFPEKLRGQLARFDLVGLAGTQKLEGPAWHWGGPFTTASRVAFPKRAGGLTAALLGTGVGAMPDVQAIDGVFMAGRRHVFEEVPFDAGTFDGFHFYDVDQSYRAYLAGFSCAVALDMFIWHESGGNFNEDWRRYAERFVTKFPIATPISFAARYTPGTWPVSARWIPGTYAWIDHWLTHADGR